MSGQNNMAKEEVYWVLPVFMDFRDQEVCMLWTASEGKYQSWRQGKRVADF